MKTTPLALSLSLVLVLVLALAPVATPAHAAELADVTMDDTAQVGDQTLVLNGLGLRKKAIFKVYVGGLYLPQKSTDGDAVLAADEPRRLVMEFVRGVGASSLTGAWDDCLKNNTPDAGTDVKKGFATLNGWMADVENEDRLVFTYVPGTGTTVTVKGEEKGTIEGKPFADALFACWIGRVPPSDDFKEGLLGQ